VGVHVGHASSVSVTTSEILRSNAGAFRADSDSAKASLHLRGSLVRGPFPWAGPLRPGTVRAENNSFPGCLSASEELTAEMLHDGFITPDHILAEINSSTHQPTSHPGLATDPKTTLDPGTSDPGTATDPEARGVAPAGPEAGTSSIIPPEAGPSAISQEIPGKGPPHDEKEKGPSGDQHETDIKLPSGDENGEKGGEKDARAEEQIHVPDIACVDWEAEDAQEEAARLGEIEHPAEELG
ncbi:hypothetical protein T484DRAFT_1818043, partial [Baffinella frigidus]